MSKMHFFAITSSSHTMMPEWLARPNRESRKDQIPIGVSNLLSLNERMPTWNHTRPREQDSHVVHYSQCAICFLLDEPYIPTLLGSLPFKHVKRRIMEFWSRESFPLTFFEASQLVEMLSHLCGPSKVGKSMYSLLLAVTGGAWCYGNYLPWPRVRFGGRLLQIWVCYLFVYCGWWVNEKNMQQFIQIHGWWHDVPIQRQTFRHSMKVLSEILGWIWVTMLPGHHGHP